MILQSHTAGGDYRSATRIAVKVLINKHSSFNIAGGDYRSAISIAVKVLNKQLPSQVIHQQMTDAK